MFQGDQLSGTILMLLFSYPFQSSCDPLYFTLVLLEVTPRIPQQCQLQFEVYSVSKELLFTASQMSLEGCTEEESDQYAQVCVYLYSPQLPLEIF